MSATAPARTLTAVIRAVLHENGNRPMRLTHVWEQVAARAPDLAGSKTHFKRHVVGQMFARDELVKARITEDVKGKGERLLYAMRLKNNAVNRQPAAPAAASAPSSAPPLA